MVVPGDGRLDVTEYEEPGYDTNKVLNSGYENKPLLHDKDRKDHRKGFKEAGECDKGAWKGGACKQRAGESVKGNPRQHREANEELEARERNIFQRMLKGEYLWAYVYIYMYIHLCLVYICMRVYKRESDVGKRSREREREGRRERESESKRALEIRCR